MPFGKVCMGEKLYGLYSHLEEHDGFSQLTREPGWVCEALKQSEQASKLRQEFWGDKGGNIPHAEPLRLGG